MTDARALACVVGGGPLKMARHPTPTTRRRLTMFQTARTTPLGTLLIVGVSEALVPGRPVTASVGLASYCPVASWEAWLKRCDDNLYSAKAAGRNRVVG